MLRSIQPYEGWLLRHVGGLGFVKRQLRAGGLRRARVVRQDERMLSTLTRELDALLGTVPALEYDAPSVAEIAVIVKRGFFRPTEEELLVVWFARFLRQRVALRTIIERASRELPIPLSKIDGNRHWRLFLVAYVSACLLVRQDRFFLWRFATHTLVQRKLNEGFPEHAIARKEFSRVYSDYTDLLGAFHLYRAIRFARKHRDRMGALADDSMVGGYVTQLPRLERYLNVSKRVFARRLFGFLGHRWRRRAASARQKVQFALLESVGRIAARLNLGRRKLVTDCIRAQIAAYLEPGDVLVSRHRFALTNFLLPGTWAHVSLYIGTPEQRLAYGITVAPAIATRWSGNRCTLEALRDGVLFRSLRETLHVDQFAVLRPALSRAALVAGIERVVKHEGKAYNFDFDFFRSDRLVCTEVIYRAYDGMEGMRLPLVMRGGRPTFAAEDLLDLALDTETFKPVAIFGLPECAEAIQMDTVAGLLSDSYRQRRGGSINR